MKNRCALILLGLAGAIPLQAPAATLTHWGTVTTVVGTDCAAPCGLTELAIGLFGGSVMVSAGGEGELMASSTLGANPHGAGEAHAEVLPGAGAVSMPHLRVAASSVGTGYVQAVAAGIQGYD